MQNILHGLSPGLSDAISSISRWSFIRASFPHILHACASSLLYRHNTAPGAKLGKAETKLLYTLHWLILDAASECEDNRAAAVAAAKKLANKNKNSCKSERKRSSSRRKNPNQAKKINKHKSVDYMHPVATIQLFVYLFVPIIKTLQPADLDNLKLVNGLRIWEPLWAHRTPDIPIFNTFVKHKHHSGEQLNQQQQQQVEQKRNLSSGSAVVVPETKIETEKPNLNIPSPMTPSKSSQGLGVSNNFGIYMGDQTKLAPPTMEVSSKRQSVSSVSSSQFDSKEKKVSITSASSEFSLNEKPLIKNLEIDSIHISDFGSDRIRDSDVGSKEKPANRNTLRAPIVHMNSICSFSDSGQSVTPTPIQEDVETLDQKSKLSLETFCPNCKRVNKQASISSTGSSKNCQNCFQLLNTSESFAHMVSGVVGAVAVTTVANSNEAKSHTDINDVFEAGQIDSKQSNGRNVIRFILVL